MRIEAMELLGWSVHDLDSAVARFTALLGLDFRIFEVGVDYEVATTSDTGTSSSAPLPQRLRIAVDATGCFELLEMPGIPEGFRNIHFRVDDMDAAVRHIVAQGLAPIQDLRAGVAREVIFDAVELYGVRLCLLEYPGESFRAALEDSPRP